MVREYYEERYDVIADLAFVTRPVIKLVDPGPQVCRFCHRKAPVVTFKKKAHAAPELLGNKTLVSKNECDECNDMFNVRYEQDLGVWSAFARSIGRIHGKKGLPTYVCPDNTMRVEHINGKQVLLLRDKIDIKPGELWLPKAKSPQTYIPLNAAKALVKVACSICPPELLPECQGAIDWIMGRHSATIAPFVVLRTFTPGPPGAFIDKVVLLRRKGATPDPFLWCLVRTAKHQLQFFVPFCGADAALFPPGQRVTINTWQLQPNDIGANWRFGSIDYFREDWSSTEPKASEYIAVFKVLEVDNITAAEAKTELGI
jgi:hypothetical protein